MSFAQLVSSPHPLFSISYKKQLIFGILCIIKRCEFIEQRTLLKMLLFQHMQVYAKILVYFCFLSINLSLFIEQAVPVDF